MARFRDTLLRLLGATSGETILKAAATASGTITLPAGTTDFSATGGTSQVVKQTSAGGAFTVGQLAETDISGSSWSTYTPTVSSFSGSFTSVSATGRYKQLGKTVHIAINVSITTNGTAATDVRATLPVNAYSGSTQLYCLAGRAANVSGKMLQGVIFNTSPTLCIINNYDNTYPGGTGEFLVVTGIYEAA